MQQLVNRIFEAQHLKQIKHEWRRLAGVQFPDSVAEHALVAAQIGRYLAVLEWVDPYRVVTTIVFHDLTETRIGDLHRVATRYIQWKDEAEQQICREQMDEMPWGNELHDLFMAYEARADDVGVIAKDADYLEQAFQAKIYLEQGHEAVQTWIDNIGNVLRTESAKQLWTMLQNVHYTDRRKDLMKRW